MKSALEQSGIDVKWLCRMWGERLELGRYEELGDLLHGWRMLTMNLSSEVVDDIWTLKNVVNTMREEEWISK